MREIGAEDLLAFYARGVFPMSEARDDDTFFLVDPQWRGVVPLDRFHVPRRLARTVRSNLYRVQIDTAFPEVLAACAGKDNAGREETWISRPIESLYGRLYELGCAHSVECWDADRLVGGLYGVTLGRAFFGESMFSRARDASKVALVHLVARLRAQGFLLLDTQFITDHLLQFGAEEIPKAEYMRRLGEALDGIATFGAQPAYDGEAALQLISQAS